MSAIPTVDGAPGDLVIVGTPVDDGQPVRVTIRDGRIAEIERIAGALDAPWLAPGWLDLQVNGFEGHDPNAVDADPDATAAMVRSLWRFGVTGECVTICTESEAHMVQSLAAVAEAAEKDPLIAESIVGIHVEGPHLAREDGPRGAHPLRHVRPPDIEEYRRWQSAARGRIRIITLSPEYDEAIPYIEAIVADGVVASIGHTAASSEQIRAAVDAGARWSTHLGNGAHAMIRRHPNYVWDQLAEDRLSAGFIFDGQHLPAAVMKSVIRAKGIERSILVSDAVFVGGLEPGVYQLPDGAAVELDAAGRLALQGTPYLAGAAAPLSVGIANATRHAGVTLAEAMRFVTSNPSRLLGLPIAAGHESLRVGMTANLTLFRGATNGSDVEVLRTIVAGHVVHDAATA
jgi:N-acetylglucosamine-6-phosphate deacetylase